MFYINETSIDHHETFFEHFKLRLTELNSAAVLAFRVNQNLATWKVRFFFTNRTKKDFFAHITLTASRQDSVSLNVSTDFRTQDHTYILRKVHSFTIQRYDVGLISKKFIVTSRSNIVNNPVNRLLAADHNTFIVRMRAAYIIASHRNVVTSPSQFVAREHKTVEISHTWTVCGLTLPLNGTDRVESARFPAAFNASLPLFQIRTYPGTKAHKCVSNYIILSGVPYAVKLPLTVKYSFKLINSADKRSAIAQYETVQQFNLNKIVDNDNCFKYSDFVTSMDDHQCFTIECRIAFDNLTKYKP